MCLCVYIDIVQNVRKCCFFFDRGAPGFAAIDYYGQPIIVPVMVDDAYFYPVVFLPPDALRPDTRYEGGRTFDSVGAICVYRSKWRTRSFFLPASRYHDGLLSGRRAVENAVSERLIRRHVRRRHSVVRQRGRRCRC